MSSLRLSERHLPMLLVLAISAVIALASCGDNADVEVAAESGASTTSEPESGESLPLPGVRHGGFVTEQDVGTARSHYETGLETWTAADLEDYTLEVSLETIVVVEIEVVDGVVASEKVTNLAHQEHTFADSLPRSIEELFSVVDQELAPFEADPDLVPSADECGRHFNIMFDQQFGYPTYYDSLGPCDDGVGVRVTVTPS